ncbi:MAG: chromate transporter, partial [Spirochaetota bacterium]
VSTGGVAMKSVKLFLTFLKIAAVTIGGGYGMIPVIEDEIVRSAKYMPRDEFFLLISKAQLIPGPIAFNAAVFIGHKIDGLKGAIFSGVGVIIPPFITIIAIASFLRLFSENLYVQYFLKGARVATLAVLLNLALSMVRRKPTDRISILLVIGLTAVAFAFNLMAIVALLLSTFVFTLYMLLRRLHDEKKKLA